MAENIRVICDSLDEGESFDNSGLYLVCFVHEAHLNRLELDIAYRVRVMGRSILEENDRQILRNYRKGLKHGRKQQSR